MAEQLWKPETMTTNNGIKFLLVDDLEANLFALHTLLKREGLELLMARSGQEALELLLLHDISLAFLDVQMPEMDGFELAELMRGTERTRRVPIIFVTAGARDEQRRFQGYDLGAVDFLFKPIDPHVLKSKADVFYELARQQNELKVAQEALRNANKRKDEFIAILAHELRNPLAPIQTALQILNRTTVEDANAVRAREIINRQMKQMVRLIDDLLDVGRISSGKLQVRPQHIDLRLVIDQAIQTSRPHIDKFHHKLIVSLPNENVRLFADPVRLSQIFSNLLNNASKFTEPNGQIWLTAECENSKVIVKVTDTGIGLSQDQLPRIFELFSQVDSDQIQEGLGIGLSLVKSLVQMHDGQFDAKSDGIGKGSEFTVTLPLATNEELHSDPSNDLLLKPDGPANLRLLIVDDNRDNAECLALLLENSGYETQIANDGLQAVKSAEHFRPDAAVLDIGMPKLNGLDACRRIRSQPWGQSMIIIALSGWGAENDRKAAKDAGFDSYLVKPIDSDDVVEALSTIRRNRNPI